MCFSQYLRYIVKLGGTRDSVAVEKARFEWGIRSLPWLILTDRKHVVTAEGFSVAELDEKLNSNSN